MINWYQEGFVHYLNQHFDFWLYKLHDLALWTLSWKYGVDKVEIPKNIIIPE